MSLFSRDWLERFRESLDEEFGDRPRIAALATVDGDGQPHVRHVVCRRIEGDGTLWVASDARSEKNAQLRAQPAVELGFWLSGRREQFRISGVAEVLTSTPSAEDSRRNALWVELSDSARALFLWPCPGELRTGEGEREEDYLRVVSAVEPMPDNFELLVIKPKEVDFLDLKVHPHERWRAREVEGWRIERLNP